MTDRLLTFLIGIGWFLVVVLILFAAAQPVSLRAQLFICIVILVLLGFLKLFPHKPWMRSVFLALGTFLVLRYIFWRTANTVPPITELQNFIPGFALYMAELYAIFMFFISIFVVINPLRRKRAKLPTDEDKLPSVDVYVPSYNEDLQLVATTLMAAQNMRYPADKMRVYLLDDGGTVEKREHDDPDISAAALERHIAMKQLCEDLGVTYLTRERNEHAKAGNLNAAFHRTSGDLIALFDADHVPAVDFLEKTVGYFWADEEVFLVQTPHFFINPDPVERNLKTFDKMPSENEMFYRYIQTGLDKWNASFFCGSAALMGRKALEEVDGFSGASVTEDAETALELHSRGWKSVYHDEPLIAGLQPETFLAFIGQRSRWSQGMMQIFMLKNPLLKPGLTLPQRLCYTSSSMFWFFPFARLAFFIAPLLYLFFNLKIYVTTVDEFLAYVLPYMVVVLVVSNYLYGNYRWPFLSELYEFVQSMYTSRALLNVLISPHSPSFNVTSKGETLEEDHISPLWKPMFIIIAFLFVGLLVSIWRFFIHEDVRGILLVVGGWNLMNLLVALAAFGVVCETRQRRRSPRMPIRRPVRLVVGGVVINARVDDTSVGGVRISVPERMAKQVDWKAEQIAIRVNFSADAPPRDIPVQVRAVRAEGPLVILGAEFDPKTDAHRRDIVRMMYANSSHWAEFQKSRHMSMGVLRGIGSFLMLAFSTVLTILRFVLRLEKLNQPHKNRASEKNPLEHEALQGAQPPPSLRKGVRKKKAAPEAVTIPEPETREATMTEAMPVMPDPDPEPVPVVEREPSPEPAMPAVTGMVRTYIQPKDRKPNMESGLSSTRSVLRRGRDGFGEDELIQPI